MKPLSPPPLDLAIIGAGICGVIALHYARRAGLNARVFERADGVGGLWRQLPAWQDIQIGVLDWQLGDLPLAGPMQPHILANIEAWVQRFGLADGIALNAPVRHARREGQGDAALWVFETPGGTVHARHLLAATGGHNRPIIPEVMRRHGTVREVHSSALRDPSVLRDAQVLVVGGGASAFDLLEQCFAQGARSVHWAHRGLKWFLPTGKPKAVAGSVRGFARMQGSGMTHEAQNAAMRADMNARYSRFGIDVLRPGRAYDVRHDQLMTGRPLMLAHFARIDRHAAQVQSIAGSVVVLSDGATLCPDWLLWGTGYALDLSYFDDARLASLTTIDALAARCGGFQSLDADNLYFPGLGLDGIGSATWAYALICRSIVSHIRGTANIARTPTAHKINHFDLVEYLAPQDPASFPGDWREQYRTLALHTPDDQTYPIPS